MIHDFISGVLMKFFAVLLSVFCALSAAGTDAPVRIADTVGDPVFRTAAIRMALAGTPVACEQVQTTMEKAFAGLQNGTYDLVLAPRSSVPEKWQKYCRDYGVNAVMIAVNGRNPRSHFTSGELAEIFSGKRRSWITLNGQDFQIHLMRMPDASSPVRIFRERIMGGNAFAPAFVRKNPAELLRLAEVNKNAIVLTLRPDAELSTGLKAASIDGIYPSLENMKTGRYPLCERLTVVYRVPPTGKVKTLLDHIFSAEMAAVIAGHGLVRP